MRVLPWFQAHFVPFSCSPPLAVSLPSPHLRYHPTPSLFIERQICSTTVMANAEAEHGAVVQNESDDPEATDLLLIKVFIKHKIGQDELVGELQGEIEGLLSAEGDDGEVLLTLDVSRSSKFASERCALAFKVSISTPYEIMTSEVAAADKSWSAVKDAPKIVGAVSGPGSATDTLAVAIATPAVDGIEKFLDTFKTFVDVVDKIAAVRVLLILPPIRSFMYVKQAHPYTSAAWAVISAGFKVLQAQQQRDAALSDLVDVMDDVCALVSASASREFHTTNPLRKIAAKLLHQATECGYFVQWYAKDKGLLERTVQNLSGSADPDIQRFIQSFERLRKAFQEHETAEIDLVVLRMVESLKDLKTTLNVNDMPYVDSACYDSDKACMSDTRTDIVREITAWVLRPIPSEDEHSSSPSAIEQLSSSSSAVKRSTASVLWLSGVAGSGKSAIAHTVAANLAAIGRLGSAFFFDEARANEQNAAALFSHISRDLAEAIPQWKKALDPIIQNTRIRRTSSVKDQFEHLILHPARECKFIGPILIVIDALDECGDDRVARNALFGILRERLHELPLNFRVVLTSRPENEIATIFTNPTSDVKKIALPGATERDLAIYYRSQLGDQPVLDGQRPDGAWIRLLVEKSEGLFQWAFTACEFMLEPGWETPERFETLLLTAELEGIDNLYRAILRSRFGSDVNDIRLPRFHAVLGRALCVRTPLPVSDLIALRAPSEKPETTDTILKWMGSVLTGVSPGSQGRVQAFHTSFRDFLFDKHRSGIFFIDPPTHHLSLAKACLTVLNKELRFNICELETSYMARHPNADVFGDRIRQHISGPLLYASEFWSHHVAEVTGEADPTLIELVQEFIDMKFLFWLELLGLTQKIYWAGGAMRTLVNWASSYHIDSLVHFGTDAERFISNFAEVIARSPPHLYISVLPFAPESSVVSQQYLSLFGNTIGAQSGKQQVWSEVVRTFASRTESGAQCIRSMAFSPDGTLLITAAEKSICIWDPESGQLLNSFPIDLIGPKVVVSPDGKFLAATTSWNSVVVQGLPLGDVLKNAKSSFYRDIICLQFSPDSKILWIGLNDGCLCTWELETERLTDPIELWDSVPETQYRGVMTISRDTRHLAFAPDGHSISIFDRREDSMEWVNRREIEINDVLALDFSPDGRSLVSGHLLGSVHVWDVESATRKDTGSSSAKHSSGVTTVSFSPNVADPVIVSCANWDVRLSDGASGSSVRKTVKGQNILYSVLFSPDGRFIITGAWDGTISLLDRQAVEQPMAEEQADRAFLSRIALSRDEKSLCASSADCSIHRFTVEDGAQIRSTGSPMRGHISTISALAISPDGKLLASGSADNTVRIWGLEPEDPLHEPRILDGHTNWVREVAFDHQGEHLVSCSDDYTIRVWDTANWTSAELRGHDLAVFTAQFYNNKNCIISGSGDETIRIWNVNSGQSIGNPLRLHNSSLWRIALSPSEELVASSFVDGTILVWDLESRGAARCQYMRHGIQFVESLLFTFNEQHLLSASDDHAVRLWDLSAEEPKQEGRPWEGHSAALNDAFFLNIQSQLISSADDGVIRIWEANESSTNPHSPAELQTSFPRIDRDGWVHSDEEEPKLLFWLPPHYRSSFVWGRCQSLVGSEPLQLDFSRFVHGDQWAECWTASSSPDTSS
ncbi:WD40 repeat-like protein [Sistotremastrum niveocremeum HHB9708]|uniref:WD40 repeat-like protein n=1 Tax=Sistotremastrum niveocremeum HHB9708 TaxID=1314777 RepID=A0A164NH08_9AGAM|nr:WD40 repeat-like protein [Sistotremastrum niveocremeum HHB9708]